MDWFEEAKRNAAIFEQWQGKNIVCYGAGSKGRQSIQILREHGIEPAVVCDGNSALWGQSCEGVTILGYDEMKKKFDDYTILLTCVWENALSIRKFLQSQQEQHPIVFFSNPYKVETKVFSLAEVEEQREALDESYHLLADDESRCLFVNFLRWKMTGDISATAKRQNNSWLEVFDSNLIPKCPDYTYVDVGAYTGDTLIRFLSFCRGQYKKILCYEPDKTNFYELEKMVDRCRLTDVEIFNIGLMSAGGVQTFFAPSNNTVYESANFFRDVNVSIRNAMIEDGVQGDSQTVKISTVDNCLAEHKNDTLLMKIDTMGSEGEIIKGASEILATAAPVVVMEYGTHSKYMADMIPFMNRVNSNYKFYLRQIYAFDNSRTHLYVIPECSKSGLFE